MNEIYLLILALVVSPVKKEFCPVSANVATAGALKRLKKKLIARNHVEQSAQFNRTFASSISPGKKGRLLRKVAFCACPCVPCT